MNFSNNLKLRRTGISVIVALCFILFNVKLASANEQVDSLPLPGTEEAVTHAETNKDEKYNPTPAIMEHISDSHSWHLWGHTSIPLPVILITDKGVETFCSSAFGHGEETHAYQGKYYTYKLEEEKIKIVDANGAVNKEASDKMYDFSITKNVAAMWISMILLILIFVSVANSYKKREGKAPKGFQSIIEPVILFVRDDIAIPNLGTKYKRYMPLLLTLFFFILLNNLLGLVPVFPGGANVTGNIIFTFVLSFIVLLVVNFSGNKYYWKHILQPDVPKWLYPIMLPVELVGIISKPFALMIRLYANISAGHIIVLSLVSLIFVAKSLWVAPVSVAFVLFMDVLELLVAFLQAFIFTMLTALFIGSAIEDHHHH